MKNIKTIQIINWLNDKAARAPDPSWTRMMYAAATRLRELSDGGSSVGVRNSCTSKMTESSVDAVVTMTRGAMLEYIHTHPKAKVTHSLFDKDEYIYLADDGNVYDENGYLFEDWGFTPYRNGLRLREGGVWEDGWRIYTG